MQETKVQNVVLNIMTQKEYDELATKNPNEFYAITDSVEYEDVEAQYEELKAQVVTNTANISKNTSDIATKATKATDFVTGITDTNKGITQTELNAAKTDLEAKIQAKDSLPSQPGNENKWLTTNGTTAAWSTLPVATDSTTGITKLASSDEITAGTSTTSVVVVKQLKDAEAAVKQEINTTIQSIEAKIPSQASATNQLADKDFVNSSIQNMAARRVYADASQGYFMTRAALLAATKFYDGQGNEYTPTTNDYTIILADEGAPAPYTGGQTRWIYAATGEWEYNYGINSTPFTSDQQKALDSGITAEKVAEIDKKVDKINTANHVYGTDNEGAQTSYSIDSFGKVDDVQVNGTTVVSNKIASITLGTMANATASDYYTKTEADEEFASKDIEDYFDTGTSDTNPAVNKNYVDTALDLKADKSELEALDARVETLEDTADTIGEELNKKADDDKVVHIDGDETINDDKTFTGEIILNTGTNTSEIKQIQSIDSTDTPTAEEKNTFSVFSKDNKLVGEFKTYKDTNGTQCSALSANNYTTDEETDDVTQTSANISVSVTNAGQVSTYAPTPVSTSNDTNIATTEWVKSRISEHVATVVPAIYQVVEDTNSVISLKDDISIYKYVYNSGDTLVFDVSQLKKPENTAITFELFVTTTDTVSTLNLPSGIAWINGQTPKLTANTSYLLAFRSFDNGATWLGNIQCHWDNTKNQISTTGIWDLTDDVKV